MKKISFVLITLAVALVLLPLTGCPTAHTDADWSVLKVGAIIGDEWATATALSPVMGAGESTTTLTFTYNGGTAWGGGNGTCNFAIQAVKDSWDAKYTGATGITPGSGFKTTILNDNANNTFTNLVVGTSYTITIVADSNSVKVKID